MAHIMTVMLNLGLFAQFNANSQHLGIPLQQVHINTDRETYEICREFGIKISLLKNFKSLVFSDILCSLVDFVESFLFKSLHNIEINRYKLENK